MFEKEKEVIYLFNGDLSEKFGRQQVGWLLGCDSWL
jgi:hypothetical protein